MVSSLMTGDEDKDAQIAMDLAEGEAGGMADRISAVQAAEREQQILSVLISHCRHQKYAEIESILDQPDFSMPIDARDDGGNTLLLVAAQLLPSVVSSTCRSRRSTHRSTQPCPTDCEA